jgi:hypothetical protein
MQISDRSYGGKIFRPEPEVFISDDRNTLIVATPWGQSAIAKDFIDLVMTYWRDSINDTEKTTIYVPDDGLDDNEHLFKMAILAAHEDLRDKYNDEELTAGLEVLCIHKNQQKISWFQLGAPSLILLREQSMMPLFHPVDFSYDFSTPEETLPPLPKELLGVQKQIQLGSGRLKIHKGDRFLLVSRSYIPSALFQEESASTVDLDNATKVFATDNESHPFWLALLLMD